MCVSSSSERDFHRESPGFHFLEFMCREERNSRFVYVRTHEKTSNHFVRIE